jgi:hypothetical protein
VGQTSCRGRSRWRSLGCLRPIRRVLRTLELGPPPPPLGGPSHPGPTRPSRLGIRGVHRSGDGLEWALRCGRGRGSLHDLMGGARRLPDGVQMGSDREGSGRVTPSAAECGSRLRRAHARRGGGGASSCVPWARRAPHAQSRKSRPGEDIPGCAPPVPRRAPRAPPGARAGRGPAGLPAGVGGGPNSSVGTTRRIGRRHPRERQRDRPRRQVCRPPPLTIPPPERMQPQRPRSQAPEGCS